MRELRASGVTFEDYAMGDEGPTTENGVARDPTKAARWPGSPTPRATSWR